MAIETLNKLNRNNNYFELSKEQSRYASLASLNANQANLLLPFLLKIQGKIKLPILQKAFNLVMQRHESLQSIFTYQQNAWKLQLKPNMISLIETHSAQDKNEAWVKQQVMLEQINAFDITVGPLCKLIVYQQEKNDYLLILTHHIITDATSLDLLVKELSYFYNAIQANNDIELPDLTHQHIDFSAWENQFLSSNNAKLMLERWSKKLAPHSQEIQLPFKPGYVRNTKNKVSHVVYNISSTVEKKMEAFYRKNKIHFFTVFSTGIAITQYLLSQQKEQCIAVPVNNRHFPELETVIGFFANLSVLPLTLEPASSLLSLCRTVQRSNLTALLEKGLSYSDLVGIIRAKKTDHSLPPVQTALSYVDAKKIQQYQFDHNKLEIIYTPRTAIDFDLFLTLVKYEKHHTLNVEYSNDLFDQYTVESIIQLWETVITTILEAPQKTLAEISQPKPKGLIADLHIAASFTLTPIEKSIATLQKKLGRGFKTNYRNYQQVIQFLLETSEHDWQNGAIICLIRLSDFYYYESSCVTDNTLQQLCDELFTATQHSINHKNKTHHFIFCPEALESKIYIEKTKLLVKELQKLPNLVVTYLTEDNNDLDIFCQQSQQAAHIPYKDSYYNYLAELLSKHFYLLNSPINKVLVLDCDNTLWSGIVGEDGLSGITITAQHQLFQQKILELHHSGCLIAIASKNNEDEVLNVFDQHQDMLLRREHVTQFKINWQKKSLNIQQIATELNLSLDAFVFIDDNSIEIMDVQTCLPQVLSLQIPTEEKKLSYWLEHCWILTPTILNNKSINRTQLYKQEAIRQQLKTSNNDLEKFIASLQLELEYLQLNNENVARASELTQRTNQFNLTTQRLSCSELMSIHQADKSCCVLLKARDKFGDYGIVGLLLLDWGNSTSQLKVTNFLLSCRVLGRGLELQVLYYLYEFSTKRGLTTIEFQYFKNEKNVPGINFIKILQKKTQQKHSNRVQVLVANLNCFSIKDISEPAAVDIKKIAQSSNVQLHRIEEAAYLSAIAHHDQTIETPPKNSTASLPSNTIEKVKAIFSEVSGHADLQEDRSLPEQGINSLQLVKALIVLNDQFELKLEMQDLYEHNTIVSLATAINATKTNDTAIPNQSLREKIMQDIELSYSDVPLLHSPVTVSAIASLQHILLTGATGFVGSHILNELLKTTPHIIHCCIRCNSITEGRKKLETTFKRYKINLDAIAWDKIHIIVSDLSLENLGLKTTQWQALAQQLDKIIHCGAAVNFFDSYNRIAPANVEATRTILRLMAYQKNKELFFISTLGVFHNEELSAWPIIHEASATGTPFKLPSGYQQSKWVAEKLISRANERGHNATIIRLGAVSNHSKTGALNPHDLVMRVMATTHEVGVLPEMRPMDILPVDFVSQAIVKIQHQVSLGQIYHLIHPKPLATEDYVKWNRVAGHNMQLLCFKQWQAYLDNFLNNNPEHHLALYAPLITTQTQAKSFLEVLLLAPKVDCTNTQLLLAQHHLEYPELNQQLMFSSMDEYIALKWLPKEPSINQDVNNWLFRFPEFMQGFCIPHTGDTDDAHYETAYKQGQREDIKLSTHFIAHVEDHIQLIKNKKVLLTGEVICKHVSDTPLTVTYGYFEPAAYNGYRPNISDSFIYLRYWVELENEQGKKYIFEAYKLSKEFSEIFSEVSTLFIKLYPAGSQKTNGVIGKISMPFETFFSDQFKKIVFRESLHKKQEDKHRIQWLLWLALPMLKNYSNLAIPKNEFGWQDLWEWLDELGISNRLETNIKKMAPLFNRTGILSKFITPESIKWFLKKK